MLTFVMQLISGKLFPSFPLCRGFCHCPHDEAKFFNGTAIENFTMDSFIKRIMLSAVYIVEKKTSIHVSFSPHHRHLEELTVDLERLTA